MRVLSKIALLAISAISMSCVSGSRTDPATGVTTKYCLIGTDAQSVVVDGPMPTVVGYAPVLNKKGEVKSVQPLFGAPANGTGNALFASYGITQSKGLGKITSAITSSVASYLVGQYFQNQDNNATSVDLAKETTAQKASDNATSVETLKETNRSKEALAEMEVTTP